MVEIAEVKTRRQRKDFAEFPLKLYKNCEYYVPDIYGDIKEFFKKPNVYEGIAEATCFNAYRNGKQVGRIAAVLPISVNKKCNQKRIRFTRFDCVDDIEVATALFDAVRDFGIKNGMTEMVGPLGFSDLDKQGMLVEGFDQMSTFSELYNYEYYKKLTESYGFVKDIDWVERQLRLPKEENPRYRELSDKVLSYNNLHIAECKSIKDFIKRYKDQFFDVFEETYSDLYGVPEFTDKMKQNLVSSFTMITDTKHAGVIVDENDRVVAFGICFPSIAKSLRDVKGKLFPFGFVKVLHEAKHPTVIELGLVGVRREYQMRGVASVIVAKILDMLKEPDIEYAETNQNLEDNTKIQNQWKAFDAILNKRRRVFVKSIE